MPGNLTSEEDQQIMATLRFLRRGVKLIGGGIITLILAVVGLIVIMTGDHFNLNKLDRAYAFWEPRWSEMYYAVFPPASHSHPPLPIADASVSPINGTGTSH